MSLICISNGKPVLKFNFHLKVSADRSVRPHQATGGAVRTRLQQGLNRGRGDHSNCNDVD